MSFRLVVQLCAAVALTGCANFNTAYRQYSAKDSVMVDVKQRAIISKPSFKGSNSNEYEVCAEPSPDALSVAAASASGSASFKDQVSANGSLSTQESAAYVGLRTPSIQLLRDAMFRLCEGHANGAIDDKSFQFLSKRYQRNMVALLAIEQLTGAVRVPPVTLTGTSSGSTTGSNIDALVAQDQAYTQKISSLQDQSDDLGTQLAAAQAKVTADSSDTDAKAQVTTLTKKKKAVDDNIASQKLGQAAIEAAMKNPTLATTSASGAANVSQIDMAKPMSDATAASISTTVKEIVNNITNGTDDIEEMCLTHFASLGEKSPDTVLTKVQLDALPKEKRDFIKSQSDSAKSVTDFCMQAIAYAGKRLFPAH